MEEENILDFNFWPSFSDLMLSLVLILVLVLFLVSAILNVGTINLSHVENNQQKMIDTIGRMFGVSPEGSRTEEGLYMIPTSPGREGDIFIKNEPTVQKITFSSNILFPPDEIQLNERGKRVLKIVGEILKKNIKLIREIQIQGHADPTPTRRYESNMHLASMRAISVFNFLNDELQIDPIENLMSITSFGEYKPVQRSEDETNYRPEILAMHNRTSAMKERNRRIELLLFYHY
jgi:flagellar motor protein MotB